MLLWGGDEKFSLVKRRLRGGKGVKNRRFSDDIVYGRPLIIYSFKNTLMLPVWSHLKYLRLAQVRLKSSSNQVALLNES